MKFWLKLIHYVFPTAELRNFQTVHYAFSFLFLFAAVIGMAAVITNDVSYIKITTPLSQVEIGEQFHVDVYAYAHTPINAVDVAIAFPSDQVEVLGIDKGESVLTLWTQEPFIENGKVILRGGTYKKGFIGEHKIATINVRATKTGQATFLTSSAQLLAGDGKGTIVKTSLDKGVIQTYITKVGTNDNSLQAETTFVVITDIDKDGRITLKDISSFMASWSGVGPKYDFNNDGKMSFRDFSIILAAYFTQSNSGSI